MASVSVCEEPLYPIITSCLLCVTRDNWRHSANYQVTAEPERETGRETEREDQEDSSGEIQIQSV